MGGYLVNINSMAEYAEIQSELLELRYTDVAFWIGAKRIGTDSSFAYNWIGEDGVPSLHPIDYETQLDGIRPWAIGEPSYRNVDGEEERYARMVYRPEEARWVWEDTAGQAEAGVKTGYIVELDEAEPLFVADFDFPPTLAPLTEPEPPQAPEDGEAYSIRVLGMEENSVLLKVTAQESCSYLVRFWNIFNDKVEDRYHYYYGVVEEGVRDRVIRVMLTDEHYNSLAAQIQIRGDLHRLAEDTRPEAIKGFLATDYCHRYGLEKNMDDEDRQPVRATHRVPAGHKDPAYRLTVVRASNPADADAEAVVEILDSATRAMAATTSVGTVVYLRPGDYVAHAPDSAVEDVAFTVADGPLTVALPDQPLSSLAGKAVDGETGAPAVGADLSLEIQGRVLETTTDASGAFSFSDLPGVCARLSLENTWGTPFDEYAQDIIIDPGTTLETVLQLEKKDYVVFFGYWCDGSKAWYNAVEEFHSKTYDTADPWFLGKSMFVAVEESFDMLSPDHEDVLSTALENDAVFNVEHDHPMDKIASRPDPLGYVEGHFRVDGVRSELLVITGYVREDRMKENNLHFNEWFEGWSDQLIEIEDMDNLENAYYRRLFQRMEEGVNPLSDKILYEIFKRHLKEGGLTDEEIYQVVSTVDEAPEPYRGLYLLTLFQYALSVNEYSEKSEYNPADNTVHMKPQLKDHFIDTFFHESGHGAQVFNWTPYAHPPLEPNCLYDIEAEIFDHLRGDVENELRWRLETANSLMQPPLSEQALQTLLDTFISAEKDGETWFGMRGIPDSITEKRMAEVYKLVRDALELHFDTIPYSNASMVSDIYGGFTNIKLDGNATHYTKNYWYDENGIIIPEHHLGEAWAEYFSAKMTNDEENINRNREFFPTATTLMDGYANVLEKYYLDRLKQRYPKIYDGMDEVPWIRAEPTTDGNAALD